MRSNDRASQRDRWSAPTASLGALVLALSALVHGCVDERDEIFEQERDFMGPVEAGGTVFYAESVWQELWALTPEGEDLARSVTPLDGRPLRLVPTPDDALLVLTKEPSALVRVRRDGAILGRYDLPSDYDAITISDDGRFAIASFAGGGGSTDDRVFRNLSEISIIDLSLAQSDTNPRELTVRGNRPIGYSFAPPFTLGDSTKRMAIARARNALSLIDLTTDSAVDRQRLIPLAEPSSTRTLIPTDVVFTEDDPTDDFDMKMFVRVTGTTEVYAIDIVPAPLGSEREIQPSINQIAAGASPQGLVRYFTSEGREKLLVPNGSRQSVVVIDVQTSATTTIDVGIPVASALTWEALEGERVEPRALLYYTGSAFVAYVDLERLERQGGAAIRRSTLQNAVSSIRAVPESAGTKAIAVYSGGFGLAVLDLSSRFEFPIAGNAALTDLAFTPSADRLFGAVQGVPRLGVFDVESGGVGEIELPVPAARLVMLHDARRLFVDHDDPNGRFSVLDIDDATGDADLFFDGVFFDGLLDRRVDHDRLGSDR